MKEKLKSLPPALFMLVVLLLVYGTQVEHYFTVDNLSSICSQAAPLLVIACGQTLIILMQGTDLSLGSIVSLTAVSWIVFMYYRLPLVITVLMILILTAVLGCINGVIAAKGMLPVFIVTLGTQNIYKSLALLMSGNQTIYYDSPIFRIIAKSKFLGFTYSVYIALACVLFTWFLLNKTTLGKRIKGVGGNKEALHLSGVKTDRVIIAAFMFAGILAGIGGLLLCCRIESGNPNAGNGIEFNAIAAVLLGGTSMRNGKGGVGGTIFGVLLIQVLKSGLMQIGISSIYQNTIIGAVVLAAIILDQVIKTVQEG